MLINAGASVGGELLFKGLMRAFRSGVKYGGQRLMPRHGATAQEVELIQAYLRDNGYRIGIRAADPLTALGTRLGGRYNLRHKPMVMKAKTFFGVTIDPKSGRLIRSDMDIAWIRDGSGRFLSEREVRNTDSCAG